jgi:hypothetical protein
VGPTRRHGQDQGEVNTVNVDKGLDLGLIWRCISVVYPNSKQKRKGKELFIKKRIKNEKVQMDWGLR